MILSFSLDLSLSCVVKLQEEEEKKERVLSPSFSLARYNCRILYSQDLACHVKRAMHLLLFISLIHKSGVNKVVEAWELFPGADSGIYIYISSFHATQ
jgi:hypothetical protein